MTNNLLPCPFCGGEAGDHDYGQEYWVKCQGCGVLSAQTTDRATSDAMKNRRAAPVVERQPEGQRERFQKWVLATKHPVLGFLDGHWLERGDDREGYANEYVQGLWVAFKAFTSPPAPIAVRKLEMADVVRAHMEIPNCPVMTSNQCHALAVNLNACLDKIKELNQ